MRKKITLFHTDHPILYSAYYSNCPIFPIFWPNGSSFSSTGIVKGKISSIKKGKNGFGYDPIFIPSGYNKTFGEMKPELKVSIDHRFKAYQKIKKFFY